MAAPAPTPRRSIARVLPSPLRPALVTMLVFTALLYLIETVDTATGGLLERAGSIVPRETYGLDGIAFAPVLHGTWAHLLGNTVPFLIFGFLAMAGGMRQFVLVTAVIWILGGAAVWLVGGPNEYHVGASGVIFGWLTFLLTRGFFARSARQILLAIVLFAGWGGVLLGVLPGQPNISWQGHLFGALAGVLAAWMVARADKRSTPVPSGP